MILSIRTAVRVPAASKGAPSSGERSQAEALVTPELIL